MAKVALVYCDSYESDSVKQGIERIFALLGDQAKLYNDHDVLLKPNLCLPEPYEKALTTHPEVMKQVGIYVMRTGKQVIVGDTPVGKSDPERRKRLWEATGTNAVISNSGFSRSDLDQNISIHRLKIRAKEIIIPISSDIFTYRVVNLPKMKSHGYMLLTGAVKNLYGVLPEYTKKRLHRELENKEQFSELLMRLYQIVGCRLHIMDGIVAIEGEGPGVKGVPRKMHVLLASQDGVAVDTLAACLMNIDPLQVPTNYMALQMGFGYKDLSDLELVGDPVEPLIARDFHLPIIDSHTDRVSEKLFALSTYSVNVNRDECRLCGSCIENCPGDAMHMVDSVIQIDPQRCKSCLVCHEVCPYGAVVFKQNSFLRNIKVRTQRIQSDKKWVLVVGNPDSQYLFRRVKQEGYRIALVHDKPPRTDLSLCDFVTTHRDIRMWDNYSLAGVINCNSENGVVFCAEVCRAKGLSCYSVEAANKLTNKEKLKAVLCANNIPVAPYAAVSNFQEAQNAVNGFGVPSVIKPVDSSDSRGVYRIDHLSLEKDIFDSSKSYSHCGRVLVEEFLDGEEVDVVCIVYDYEIVFMFDFLRLRSESGPDFGCAQGFRTVTRSQSEAEQLNFVCKKVVKSLSFEKGILSLQAILTKSGWSVVEAAGRLMGGGVYEFVYFVTGVDLYRTLLHLATGKFQNELIEKRDPRPAAYLFLKGNICEPSASCHTLTGIAEARKCPGVFMLKADWLSDSVVNAERRGGLFGGVLCTGKTNDEALKNARFALNKISWC